MLAPYNLKLQIDTLISGLKLKINLQMYSRHIQNVSQANLNVKN